MYLGELYSKILKKEGKKLYGRKLIKIPTPQYIVFYNGEEDYPEKSTLKLSDAFINPVKEGEYEFTATVYNINLGKNSDLLDSCRPLKGYSTFVDMVRNNIKTMSAEEGVDAAVKYCIDRNILKDVLEEERSGVMLEMLTEVVSDKEYREYLKQEAIEEGMEMERKNTEAEKERADKAEAELAKYKAKYGDL